MLVIKIGNAQATWDDDDLEWVSEDTDAKAFLDLTIPDSVRSVEAPFKTGGRQGIAYRAARAAYGEAIQIVKRTDPSIPEDQEGVVY